MVNKLKNLNICFWFLLLANLINYVLLWRSYRLQNDLIDVRPQNWSDAVSLSELVFFAILIYCALQIILRVVKKINTVEFIICFSFNLLTLLPLFIVISDRI